MVSVTTPPPSIGSGPSFVLVRVAHLLGIPPALARATFGFVIYDSLDTETVEVWINGVKRGVAAADANNRRERLLTLVEPYDFHGGEQVRLKTPLEEGGTYRIECIALFTDLPS